MPRVSVIIPAFNAEAHIADALGSVQSQTYEDWEIVVCDDGSTDRTAERVRSFGGRVRLVRNATNAGAAVARNLAIDHSGGELLALLDADDYWLPTFLERQVALYDSGRAEFGNIGLVACNASVLHAANGPRAETHMDLARFPQEVTLYRLLEHNPIFSSVVTPRRVVDEVGGFFPELFRTQDFDLWIRIVEAGYRVVATREVLAVHRTGLESLSSDVAAMARYSQRTYRRALERGNLSPREQRVARRQLRHRRLVEKIASERGLSYGRALRTLPLLLVVVAEHPRRWRTLPQVVARGRRALAPFPR